MVHKVLLIMSDLKFFSLFSFVETFFVYFRQVDLMKVPRCPLWSCLLPTDHYIKLIITDLLLGSCFSIMDHQLHDCQINLCPIVQVVE